jgi:spore photoproduct lyase
MGCDLDCSYCILQSYLNNPFVTFYTNLNDMFMELESLLSIYYNRFYRIGTGELTDSLTFDHLNELSRELVPFFAKKINAIFELKTKSVQVKHLLNLKHNRRSVVSWSLNPEQIIQSEEPLTPTLHERLEAVREIQDAGYRLGFHFDPMIDYDNWRDGYRELVEQVFRIVKPENIAWISLGALRYPSALDEIIRERHPESRIVLGELLPGIDRKLRYFKAIRIEMFRKMHQWIKSYSQEVFVYLCMESDEVWRKALGWSPQKSTILGKLLDERVR